MKKQLLTLALSALTFSSFGMIRIVDNNGNNPKNYTSLQLALDDAVSGDTIYLKGSPYSYGDVTINTRVTLVGQGIDLLQLETNPSSKVAKCGKITLGKKYVDNTEITGVFFQDLILTNNINLININRCRINLLSVENPSFPFFINNSKFNNNIINYISNLNFSNTEFCNNIIGSVNSLNNQNSSSSTVFKNNYIHQFAFPNYMIMSNNYIFVLDLDNQSNVLNNNVVQYDNDKKLPINNINTDVDFNLEFFNSQNIFNGSSVTTSTNLHLKPKALGLKAGSDGKDVGIYGGTYPWSDFTGSTYPNTMYPTNSYINKMDLKTYSVPLNNELKLDLNVKSAK
jgi:hypothetical protein